MLIGLILQSVKFTFVRTYKCADWIDHSVKLTFVRKLTTNRGSVASSYGIYNELGDPHALRRPILQEHAQLLLNVKIPVNFENIIEWMAMKLVCFKCQRMSIIVCVPLQTIQSV